VLHLIERLVPAPVQRALMPLAHRVRQAWRQFRNTPIAGVSVIILNSSGDILLLRHSYGPKVWALPGGGIKPDEDPAAAAARELDEELDLSPGPLKRIATLEETLFDSPHTAHLFCATSDAPPTPDRREVVEARFFSLSALPDALGSVTQRRIAAFERHRADRRSAAP